jgi:hypothetical protein
VIVTEELPVNAERKFLFEANDDSIFNKNLLSVVSRLEVRSDPFGSLAGHDG